MPIELRSTTLRIVRSLLQIPRMDQLITDTDITDAMVMLALGEFSKRRPRNVVGDYIGNNESTYPLPTYWSDDFSVIKKIFFGETEYDQDGTEIDQNDYKVLGVDTTSRTLSSAVQGASQVTLSTVTEAIYFKKGDVVEIKASALSSGETNWATANGNASTGVVTLKTAIVGNYSSPVMRKKKFIKFTVYQFGTSDTFRVEYNGMHVHNDSESSIPEKEYAGFCHLVAALSAFSIAAKFSQHTQPSLENADAVDYASLSAEWQERGDKQYNLFKEMVGEVTSEGGEAAEAPAGSHFGDWDMRATHGKEFLTHRSRSR